jgi:hypothetical protein
MNKTTKIQKHYPFALPYAAMQSKPIVYQHKDHPPLTEHPSYVHDAHLSLQICTSKGKYSTEMSQLDLKMPCDSHTTSPVELTITFVLMMALL